MLFSIKIYISDIFFKEIYPHPPPRKSVPEWLDSNISLFVQ